MTSSPAAAARAVLFGETQRFLVLSVLIGLVTGLLIVCFHVSIDLVSWLTTDAAIHPVLSVLMPAAGALAAFMLIRHVTPSAKGSGIVQTKSALYVSNGFIPAGAVPGKFVACSLSIGSGAPLGPEDPSLLMGASVASSLGRVFRLSKRSMRLIAPVGAAAGIAAAFNTPITGVLFVMEEVVAAWDAAVLGSIVLAAAAAVVTTRWFLGDTPLFAVPVLPPLADPRELVVYALLGVAAGLLSTGYVRAIVAFRQRLGPHSGVPPAVSLLIAGCVVGGVGLWLPEVLGAGYRGMGAALHSQYHWTGLAILGIAKLLLAALAFGAGMPGGLFAPTLFLGVMLGGTAGGIATEMAPFETSSMTAYVLAGMGGVFAGVFRAPMTAVFMVFELSATHLVIVPAMITATLGFLVARMLQGRPLLAFVAEDEGADLPSAQAQREEEPLRVEQALRTDIPVLAPDLPIERAREVIAAAHAPAALVRLDGRGWAVYDDTLVTEPRSFESGPAGERTTVAQSTTLRVLPVSHPDEPLDTVLRLLAHHKLVPVVSRLNPQELVGVVTLDDVHRAYGFAER